MEATVSADGLMKVKETLSSVMLLLVVVESLIEFILSSLRGCFGRINRMWSKKLLISTKICILVVGSVQNWRESFSLLF